MGLLSRNEFGAEENLNKISSWLSSPNASEESRIWNYGRYAYINLTSTGNNNAGLCGPKSNATLGDTILSRGENYESTITRDGERDIPSRPILESVRIGNDGANDISDSALFQIEVSFKCFSREQFETYEAAFFTTGHEVKLTFGYKGLGLGSSIIANVFNFGFSLDASGVYSCNMKLTGANGLAAILSVTDKSTQEGAKAKDKEGTEFIGDTIISELTARFTNRFENFEESGFIDTDFVPDGRCKEKRGYAVANIQTKGGFDVDLLIGYQIDTDDMYVKYVTLEQLLDVINWCHKDSGYTWKVGENGGTYKKELCSADPSILLLDGEMANYSGPGGGDTDNNFARDDNNTNAHHKNFLISLDYIGQEIENLKARQRQDKQELGEASINNFLRNLCGKIEELTGGLYQLMVYSDSYTNQNQDDIKTFTIINKRVEYAEGITNPYEFKFLNKGSILKSVNMTSNMDADVAAIAFTSNRGGSIPTDALDSLYPDCIPEPNEYTKITEEEVAEKKNELGGGFSSERVSAMKSVLKSYVSQNGKQLRISRGYRYMIDLEVSHYGCWGARFGDTFTFSGLPSKYKKDGVYFVVGKIEHTFDAQGGWDTSITGFMKLDAK